MDGEYPLATDVVVIRCTRREALCRSSIYMLQPESHNIVQRKGAQRMAAPKGTTQDLSTPRRRNEMIRLLWNGKAKSR
jgi:hypothetical protein